MLRTPQSFSCQEEDWPWHCGGFMQYVGAWQIDDFDRWAPGRAQEAFVEACDDPADGEMYWDWLEGGLGVSEVYRCLACGKLRLRYNSD